MAPREHEEDIEKWMEAFNKLPAERQDKIHRWFATQKIIIEHTDLTVDEWFGHIQWAMDNPFDYSFILDFPDEAADGGEDAAEVGDDSRDARELVGGQTARNAPDGPNIADKSKAGGQLERELFDDFMKNRKG